MSDGVLTLLDGTHLRAAALEVTLQPDSEVSFTGAQLLELADSTASSSLFGLPSLPERVKYAALSRLYADPDGFRCSDFTREQALSKVQEYIAAIADELQDDPLVVAILDGKTLRLFLEDEDDFALLAEDLFTDLDTADKGKINKNEIRSALVHMGVEMGIPPFSEFPLLNNILKKYGAEGEEELGQAQFAQVLQPILQELADALSEKHVVLVQNIKVINGSKLRKLLANEKEINDIVEKIYNDKDKKDEPTSIKMIRGFLEKNGMDLGLPPLKAGEVVVLLYDSVFSDVEDPKNDARSDEKSVILFKSILKNFLEQLENSPVFYDVDS